MGAVHAMLVEGARHKKVYMDCASRSRSACQIRYEIVVNAASLRTIQYLLLLQTAHASAAGHSTTLNYSFCFSVQSIHH